jgi:hypothetical protein
MGRGKRNLIDVLAGLPWPAGLVVGALGYLTLAHGVPMWFTRQSGPLAQAFAGASNPFSLLGWLFFGSAPSARWPRSSMPGAPPVAGYPFYFAAAQHSKQKLETSQWHRPFRFRGVATT